MATLQVVLTSAHCVKGKSSESLQARLGEWDTQTNNEPFPHSDHDVMKIISNPDFNSSNLYNDIALLVLQTPVKLSAHINTICLPPQNFKFDNQICFASGWGADAFGKQGQYRVNLKKLELPVVPLRSCQDRLRTTKLGSSFKLHQNFLCAGGELGIDTCVGKLSRKSFSKQKTNFLLQGDGGSPLVCQIPGEPKFFVQAGIVAWGIECGHEGIPGVYANVAKFREWIDKEMDLLGYGTGSYSFEM